MKTSTPTPVLTSNPSTPVCPCFDTGRLDFGEGAVDPENTRMIPAGVCRDATGQACGIFSCRPSQSCVGLQGKIPTGALPDRSLVHPRTGWLLGLHA